MTRPLVRAVLVVLAIAAFAGALVTPPAARPPDYALGTLLIWRLEIAVAVAAALYAAIVRVALAFEGQTISRLGPGGVDIPPRRGANTVDGVQDEPENLARIAAEAGERLAPTHESSSTKHQMAGEHLRTDQERD